MNLYSSRLCSIKSEAIAEDDDDENKYIHGSLGNNN
jgi:hypothetical protein